MNEAGELLSRNEKLGDATIWSMYTGWALGRPRAGEGIASQMFLEEDEEEPGFLGDWASNSNIEGWSCSS